MLIFSLYPLISSYINSLLSTVNSILKIVSKTKFLAKLKPELESFITFLVSTEIVTETYAGN